MPNLTVERTQHSIGQGGFHSSYLYTKGSRFGVVFDCGGGTDEHRKKLVTDLVSNAPLAHDWLVISHLDEDHINGISALEKAQVRFSNVFLPHVNLPHSMFLMLLKMIDAADAAVTNDQLGAILIAGRLYAGAYGRPRIVVRGDGPNEGGLPGFDGLPDLTQGNMTAPTDLLDKGTRGQLAAKGALKTFPDSRSIYVDDVDWQFRFYSREWVFPGPVAAIWNLPVLQPLCNAINHLALLGNGNGEMFTDAIRHALDKPVLAADANRALKAMVAGHRPLRKKSASMRCSRCYTRRCPSSTITTVLRFACILALPILPRKCRGSGTSGGPICRLVIRTGCAKRGRWDGWGRAMHILAALASC